MYSTSMRIYAHIDIDHYQRWYVTLVRITETYAYCGVQMGSCGGAGSRAQAAWLHMVRGWLTRFRQSVAGACGVPGAAGRVRSVKSAVGAAEFSRVAVFRVT